jgi:hypothetical protein
MLGLNFGVETRCIASRRHAGSRTQMTLIVMKSTEVDASRLGVMQEVVQVFGSLRSVRRDA